MGKSVNEEIKEVLIYKLNKKLNGQINILK